MSPPETITAPRFARVQDYAGAWAMEAGAANALVALAKRTDLFAHVELRAAGASDPPAPARRSALDLQPDGRGKSVATVRVEGTLMKSRSSLGGSGTVQMRRDIRDAANNADVSAILLAIDSPGGTVAGTDDLAAEVRAAAKKKPVMAFVSDLCASAAYWVASQCDAIYANSETALVGSIGTLMTVYDLSKAAAAQGVEAVVFATGPLKGAGTEGTAVSEEQRAYFQGVVDDAQRSFDAAVKRGRSLSDAQLKAVRTGGVFGATEAEARKLIDGVKTYDQAVSALVKEAYSRNKPVGRGATAGDPTAAVGAIFDEVFSTTSRPARPAASDPVPNRGAAMPREADDAIELTPAGPAAHAAAVADPIAASRRQMAAELKRVAAIQGVEGAARQPALVAQAVEEGWDATQAEYKIRLANLPKVSAAGPHFAFGAGRYTPGAEKVGSGVPVGLAMEAAIRLSLGRGGLDKVYAADTLHAADECFKRLRLQQVLMYAAIENGYQAHPAERITAGTLRQVMRHAYGLERVAGGGASNISVSGILSNVANKEILAGYVESDMAWQQVAAVKPVNDFKQVTSYRLLDDMEYEELAPDGRIKNGTAGEESYTRQAKTYAKMFALTRTDWINDDLGAFDDIRTRLGRGANKKLNKVFWAKFIDNAAFFTAGRTNYITGATTNLGVDGVGLGLGVKAFRTMKSPAADGAKRVNADTQNPVGGNPGGRPEILLVPPELEGNAEVLFRNQNLGAVKNADANIYQNKYRPVVAWQLSDAAYTGNSLTAWYLLNNPAYLAAMVVSFLDGQMAPTVESADADFDQLATLFRGFHDFGCDAAEYLSGVKSKGAV